MLIKDLPEELKQLCFQRQIEQGNKNNFEGLIQTSKTSGNFDWGNTPEHKADKNFWHNIYAGIIDKNHQCYPKTLSTNYEIY